MLLALFAFRRRGALAVLVMMAALPMAMPTSAHAADGTWWQRGDQVDQQRLSTGVDAYRKGDFKAAQQQFEGIDTDAGWYNLGNALARQGQYDAAIDAYDRALKKHPGMADAVANRAAVDAARKRKPPRNNDQNNDQQDGKNPPDKPDAGKKQGQGQGKEGDGSPPPSSGDPKDGQSTGEKSPQAADSQAQAEADAAQRERMQQAMQRQGKHDGTDKAQGQVSGTPQQREQQQAVEAWMRRVPDDPGSLLRAKFQLENERRKREGR
jgi:Ca-activated chloride channel family protein